MVLPFADGSMSKENSDDLPILFWPPHSSVLLILPSIELIQLAEESNNSVLPSALGSILLKRTTNSDL